MRTLPAGTGPARGLLLSLLLAATGLEARLLLVESGREGGAEVGSASLSSPRHEAIL